MIAENWPHFFISFWNLQVPSCFHKCAVQLRLLFRSVLSLHLVPDITSIRSLRSLIVPSPLIDLGWRGSPPSIWRSYAISSIWSTRSASWAVARSSSSATGPWLSERSNGFCKIWATTPWASDPHTKTREREIAMNNLNNRNDPEKLMVTSIRLMATRSACSMTASTWSLSTPRKVSPMPCNAADTSFSLAAAAALANAASATSKSHRGPLLNSWWASVLAKFFATSLWSYFMSFTQH